MSEIAYRFPSKIQKELIHLQNNIFGNFSEFSVNSENIIAVMKFTVNPEARSSQPYSPLFGPMTIRDPIAAFPLKRSPGLCLSSPCLRSDRVFRQISFEL